MSENPFAPLPGQPNTLPNGGAPANQLPPGNELQGISVPEPASGKEHYLKPDDATKYNDEGYEGERFSKAYGVRGPARDDRFTDAACCVIFLIFLFFLILITLLNLANSKVHTLNEVMDSSGKRCGLDRGYEAYGHLLMFTFKSPYKSVCVKECPRFDYNQIKYNSTGTNSTYIKPVYHENFSIAVETGKRRHTPN